ncbi:outer membrane lipoprotein carrier protein LolA, partial [Lysinibacillus sp. D4A3_S15]|uniref:outer membrane lipoprotein carrier protein LolA n=1 Tax=Lysinibacillus sp. D4A3_S15 TaxID=2941227 RepID=UPI0037C7A118
SLFGDIEAWIDKKTWLTLKMKSDNAGNQMITEYSKINVGEKIDDQQFMLDLPKDVIIQEISGEDTSELISLDEAKQQLEKFLTVPQTNGLSIDKISMVKGLEDRLEYSFDIGLDGELTFFVTIFKADDSIAEMGPILHEKEIDIRGQKGTVMDDKNFRLIAWQENGYQYSIVGENPELTI